jgi:hypothetical protein
MRTIKLTVNDIIQQLFPVWLRRHIHLQALFLKVAFFLGDHNWRTIGQLDKAKLQFIFFQVEQLPVQCASNRNRARTHR